VTGVQTCALPISVDNHPPTLATCEEPAIGSPTLRLLTRFEFQNTIDDVFPGIAGQWTSSMPSNLVTEAGFDNDRSAVLGGQAGEGLLRTAESIGDAVAGDRKSVV